MQKRYDAVFFDMGFTLVDFYPSVLELNRRAFQEIGVSVSAEELLRAWQTVDRDFYRDKATMTFEPTEAYDNAWELEYRRRILHELGIDDENLAHILREKEAVIYSEPGAMRLYPEVLAVLTELRERGYRLGIISNWSWNLKQRCQQVGIADYFDLILASAYAGCYKPNPAIFRRALDSLQVTPQRAIHVGDDYEADVLGAQSAGLDSVLIYRKEGTPNFNCIVIRDLRELIPVLEMDQPDLAR